MKTNERLQEFLINDVCKEIVQVSETSVAKWKTVAEASTEVAYLLIVSLQMQIILHFRSAFSTHQVPS